MWSLHNPIFSEVLFIQFYTFFSILVCLSYFGKVVFKLGNSFLHLVYSVINACDYIMKFLGTGEVAHACNPRTLGG